LAKLWRRSPTNLRSKAQGWQVVGAGINRKCLQSCVSKKLKTAELPVDNSFRRLFCVNKKYEVVTMRIAICEDESTMQQRLSDAITDWAASRKIQIDILCYQSAEEFMFAWPDIPFDLAFLDIQMKGMTGIDLAEQIRKTDKNIMIVFVTSFSQYVLKGYDVNALHYLIKPLSQSKLLPILDKANTIYRSHQNETLLVSNGNGQMKLPFSDIYCISMLSHTANIHTENSTYELRKTAEELLNLLPWYFIRCHRSYIVNLLKADCVYKSSLLLSNGKSLPISRNNSKTVNDAFVKLHTER
jgi:DNA-binding LytR/AlgR family response regulator